MIIKANNVCLFVQLAELKTQPPNILKLKVSQPYTYGNLEITQRRRMTVVMKTAAALLEYLR